MTEALSARQLNQATLARQLLRGRERLDVVDALRRVVALQAQEPASPYIARWPCSRPPGLPLNDRRYAETGLTTADADAVLSPLFGFATEGRRPRSSDPDPFGRYDHWWDELPRGEDRLLPASASPDQG